MAAATSTTQAQLVAEYYDRFMLDNLYPDLYFYQFGDKKRVPPGMGKVIHFTRWTKIPIASATSLTEGTARWASGMSATRVSATVSGFGVAVRHSDFIVMTGITDIVTDSVQEVSKALALRIDTVTRAAISSQGSLWGASSVKSTGAADLVKATTPVVAGNIIQVQTKLRSNNAKTFNDGCFVGIAHPNAIHDIQADTTTGGWIDINKYATGGTVDNLYRGEVGKMYGVRFVMSSDIPKTIGAAGTSATTGLSSVGGSGYFTYIFGPGAYGVVELDGGSAKTFIKQLGSGGTNDPINQLATVGAKVYFSATQLDASNRLYRLMSGSATF